MLGLSLGWAATLILPAVVSAAPAPWAESRERGALDQLAGTWDADTELAPAEWTPKFVYTQGVVIRTWTLGGRVLEERRFDADGTTSLTLLSHTPEKGYRMWAFGSDGSATEWSGQYDERTRTFTWRSERTDGLAMTSTLRVPGAGDPGHDPAAPTSHTWAASVVDKAGKVYYSGRGGCRPMKAAGAIAGTLINSARKPLVGAKVTVFAAGRQRATFSDAAGAYRVEGVPPGQAVIWVNRVSAEPHAKSTVTVKDRDTLVADLQVPSRPPVKGRVLDARGKPVPGAFVVWTTWVPQMSGTFEVTTDAEGRFNFPGVHEGAWKAIVRMPDRSIAEFPFPITGDEPVEVDLRFPQTGRLVVRVIHPDGQPVVGVPVRLSIPSNGGAELSKPLLRTDERGRCEFGPVEAGPHSVGLEGRERTASGSRPSEKVVIEPDKAVEVTFTVAKP